MHSRLRRLSLTRRDAGRQYDGPPERRLRERRKFALTWQRLVRRTFFVEGGDAFMGFGGFAGIPKKVCALIGLGVRFASMEISGSQLPLL